MKIFVLVVVLIVALVLSLLVYRFAPNYVCRETGGQPTWDGSDLTWCDMDHDGRLSEGDRQLIW